MNKKDWMKTILVHRAHQNNKTEWTVREIWEKTGKTMSQKQIRRGLHELEEMGLIEHKKNEWTYYFQHDA